MAGCLAQPTPDADDRGLLLQPLQAFTAEYDVVADNAEVVVSLAGPFSVRDSHGVKRPAHRLSNTFSGTQVIQYLDADLNVVRVDNPCATADVGPSGCQRYNVQWTNLGVPFLGYGWPILFPDAAIGREARELVLQVGTSTYHYGTLGILPDEVRQDGVVAYRLREITRGAAPILIEPWPSPLEPETAARGEGLFPGDDRTYFGHKVTPRRMYEELLKHDEPREALEAGGCVQGFLFWQSGSVSWDLLVQQNLANQSTGTFSIQYPNGTVREWNVVYATDPTRANPFVVTPDETERLVADCDTLLDSPWPSFSMDQAVAKAATVPVRRSDQHAPTLRYALEANPGEVGHDVYVVLYNPWWHESGASYYYEVAFNANTGAFRYITFHPDDQKVFDA